MQQPQPGLTSGGQNDRPSWAQHQPVDLPPPAQQPRDGSGQYPADGVNFQYMDPEEGASLSLSRKYGYAIMALSVVVLAVLMVATIFCCNSSNSTMSQAANAAALAQAQAAHLQGDNYSIYSFKGGQAGAAGTLLHPHSAHTLGMSTMRTETLKSLGGRSAAAASPQYRVSDLDPEYGRRTYA